MKLRVLAHDIGGIFIGGRDIVLDTNFQYRDNAAMKLTFIADGSANHRDHYDEIELGFNPAIATLKGPDTTVLSHMNTLTMRDLLIEVFQPSMEVQMNHYQI